MKSVDQLEFLSDIIPEKVPVQKALANKAQHLGASDSAQAESVENPSLTGEQTAASPEE